MDAETRETLRTKVLTGATADGPSLTRRDIRLPKVPGKALAVIGMRRAGKTTFLWQCLGDRLRGGRPRESQLYFNFEDDRLAGLEVSDLQWLLETYFQLYPEWRDRTGVTFYLDEIQTVPGWERFVRRLLDSEAVEIFLSGSSARLLSREVATSMRGRAMEVLVHPFNFHEWLAHRGEEFPPPFERLSKAARSALDKRLREYLVAGGFPEVQGAPVRDRETLLRGYVDLALLRDVIERHSVSNPVALRWMVRQLLGNAAGSFSVQKFHDGLRSQGIAVAKDTVHAYLAHLEDAFLVRVLSLHTASERQRMVNPRKTYPIDPGLIPLYERTGRANLGHALETAVLLELDRRGAETGYLRMPGGFEVDFHARFPEGPVRLIQVCADSSDARTANREIRGLDDAATVYPKAERLLLTLDMLPPKNVPPQIHWVPAAAWLLGE